MLSGVFTRVFSSLILREIIKEVEQIGEGINIESEDWAAIMERVYSEEMEEQPIVYLRERENYQARKHLAFHKNVDVNLAERATHLIRGQHAAEIRKFLQSEHGGWPLLAVHERVEEDHYPFPSDEMAPTCFKEWFAVATVWRLTLAMSEISFQDATIGTDQSLISPFPALWEEKLDECMQITDPSAVIVPAPRGCGLNLRRRDINSVLPLSDGETDESGLLTDGIIRSWFDILLSHRNKSEPDKTVVILPDSLDLVAATPDEIADRALMVDEDIDMILFPTVIKEQNHCVLVVAYPQRYVLAVYDSRGYGSTKRLEKDMPWIRENYRPKGDQWEVVWMECPNQGDEEVCGVFMLINALFAVEVRDTAKGYSIEDSMFLRRYVAAVICMGQLPERF